MGGGEEGAFEGLKRSRNRPSPSRDRNEISTGRDWPEIAAENRNRGCDGELLGELCAGVAGARVTSPLLGPLAGAKERPHARMVRILPCDGRLHALSVVLLNTATFPPPLLTPLDALSSRHRSVLDLHERLQFNTVMVALDDRDDSRVLGSVEIHTAEYLRRMAPELTPPQQAKLQPYLASLAVDEGARGRGIGRALVEAAVVQAREAVIAAPSAGDRLMLQVYANNTAAVALYTAAGFRTLSAPGCEIALMQRRLLPPAAVSPTKAIYKSSASETHDMFFCIV